MAKCPKCRKVFETVVSLCVTCAVATVPVYGHAQPGGTDRVNTFATLRPVAIEPIGFVPFEPLGDRPELPHSPEAPYTTHGERINTSGSASTFRQLGPPYMS
jgi:hypothetical protein